MYSNNKHATNCKMNKGKLTNIIKILSLSYPYSWVKTEKNFSWTYFYLDIQTRTKYK